MELNLPIMEPLSGCRNVLIAGMGGGFDVYGGLPVYFELKRRGLNVHLSSLSFSSHLDRVRGGVRLTDSLVGVTAAHEGVVIYFPELYLARWFRERRGEEVTVWSFRRTGVQPLLQGYRGLAEHLELDAILLIDGGVDALIRGDETVLGTAIDDSLTLTAVSELAEVPIRLLGCLGFGAENDVPHAQILENIAGLTEVGAFLGACALVPAMEPVKLYEEALEFAHSQRFQDPSVIQSSVLSAVNGRFGDYHATQKTSRSRLWISPLMPLYWFFDAGAVAERNLFVSALRWTDTSSEAAQAMAMVRRSVHIRKPSSIPLP